MTGRVEVIGSEPTAAAEERARVADDDALARARGRLRGASILLAEAGAPDEVVAERIVPRRMLGIARPDRLREVGRAWRLGVLLLGRDGVLRATGTTFRSGEPAHSALRSRIAEERLELQRAARRGRIRDGETVNVDASVIALDGTPLPPPLLRSPDAADRLLVRWARGTDPVPFDRYLDEQLALHLHPPEGAGEAPRSLGG